MVELPTPEEAEAAMLAGFRGVQTPEVKVVCPSCGHRFSPDEQAVRTTEAEKPAAEAMIDGQRSFDDLRDLVRRALEQRVGKTSGDLYAYVYVADLTDTQVIYSTGSREELWQCSYAVDVEGNVALGDPEKVVRTYAPAPAAQAEPASEALIEERDHPLGRVLEAKGTDKAGGRVFGVRVIAYGDSRNARRYPEAVLRPATGLYEGAKVYDHHRDDAELKSSTIAGLVGSIRDVQATADGLEADLHLLPSAVHAAEALDASLAAQTEGLGPLVGVSHDVLATYKPIVDAPTGRRLQEATAIVKVNSADLVADPAAGGQAIRMVAGGDSDTPPPDSLAAADMPKEGSMDPKKLREALGLPETATDAEVAQRLREGGVILEDPKPEAKPEDTPKPPEAPKPEREQESYTVSSFLGRQLVRAKVEDAGLPASVVESVTQALPARVTEADVDHQIAAIKTVFGLVERSGLTPGAGQAQVTQESLDKKVKALDAMFAGNYRDGYRSFKEAFADITGKRPRNFDEDFNRTILRECIGSREYDSATRSTEALDTTSFDVILGDSVTRRMVAEYAQPSLGTWRNIVSSVVPVNDFRTQRIDRLGGYGVLPAVNQGAPYQPLTSPTDEEVTYAITKRGGTEDLTLEMIANDDMRAIQRIPTQLGRAAAQTLYRFVWDILPTNPAIYDSVALFHASHANTSAVALNQANLSARRAAMRGQVAYNDSSDVLSIVPRWLVVPSALEETAYQLVTSAVAIPSSGNASDIPNIHQGLGYLTVDYYSDANDWYVVADPAMVPTIEVGFYQGREDPELFTQADPTVGSMFNADKLTLKIRHIYSGAVLDFRGFQRGTQ